MTSSRFTLWLCVNLTFALANGPMARYTVLTSWSRQRLKMQKPNEAVKDPPCEDCETNRSIECFVWFLYFQPLPWSAIPHLADSVGLETSKATGRLPMVSSNCCRLLILLITPTTDLWNVLSLLLLLWLTHMFFRKHSWSLGVDTWDIGKESTLQESTVRNIVVGSDRAGCWMIHAKSLDFLGVVHDM